MAQDIPGAVIYLVERTNAHSRSAISGSSDASRLSRLVVHDVNELVRSSELFDLAGRRALVTGGGGGLGSALAAALADAGANVALIGRSETVDAVAGTIGGFAVRADLDVESDLRRAFEECVMHLGGLDILVVCHGVNHVADALAFPLTEWDKVISGNLTTVFLLCQLAGQIMVAQRSGKIITVASMLSFSGGLRVAAYAASKGGVAQMTKALANEWARHGVNVNAIAPGYIRTSLNKHVWNDPERTAQVFTRLPAGRWGEPRDLNGAVMLLASHAGDYIHGAVIPVDGGWLAR